MLHYAKIRWSYIVLSSKYAVYLTVNEKLRPKNKKRCLYIASERLPIKDRMSKHITNITHWHEVLKTADHGYPKERVKLSQVLLPLINFLYLQTCRTRGNPGGDADDGGCAADGLPRGHHPPRHPLTLPFRVQIRTRILAHSPLRNHPWPQAGG
jgi:hypothetical protein